VVGSKKWFLIDLVDIFSTGSKGLDNSD
jgi:hypothetical protein